MIKKIFYWLQKWDVMWSAPLAFVAFIAFALIAQLVFGESFGSYDPSMYQAAIYAIGISVLFNGTIFLGLWFNWRKIYNYYLTDSKKDFEKLEAWQRLFILFVSYWLYFLALLLVWLKLV